MADQILSALRSIVIFAAGWLAAHGWGSTADLMSIGTALNTALPALVALGTAVWGFFSHRAAAKVEAVNTLLSQGDAKSIPTADGGRGRVVLTSNPIVR